MSNIGILLSENSRITICGLSVAHKDHLTLYHTGNNKVPKHTAIYFLELVIRNCGECTAGKNRPWNIILTLQTWLSQSEVGS